MGLECIGAVDDAAAAQVVSLALRSLALTGRDFVLEISHMGFVTGLFDAVGAQEAVRPRLLTCIRDKNVHELRKAAEAAGLSRQGTDALCRLGTLAGPWQEVLAAAEVLALNAAMGAALEELRGLCRALEDQGQTDHWKLDFSLVNDMEYYNGLVLQGYLAGAPRAVLRGGQYDPLAEQFRPGARAIGFALYLDELDRLSDAAAEPAGLVMLNVARQGPPGRQGLRPAGGRGLRLPGKLRRHPEAGGGEPKGGHPLLLGEAQRRGHLRGARRGGHRHRRQGHPGRVRRGCV